MVVIHILYIFPIVTTFSSVLQLDFLYCQFNKRISFWLVDWRNTLPCQKTHFLMLCIQINLSLKLLTKMADMKICVYAYIHVYIHIIGILYAFFDSFFNTIGKRSVIFSIREKIGKMFQIFM